MPWERADLLDCLGGVLTFLTVLFGGVLTFLTVLFGGVLTFLGALCAPRSVLSSLLYSHVSLQWCDKISQIPPGEEATQRVKSKRIHVRT